MAGAMIGPSELQLTAYHEAGHATMMHLRSMPVMLASIRPSGESLGHVQMEVLRCQRAFCTDRQRAAAVARIEVLLAGPMAEACRIAIADCGETATIDAVMGRFEDTARGQRDMRSCAGVAKAISFSRHEARHLTHHLAWRIAGRFIGSRRVWGAVTTLAAALVEHGELDGSHVHWLLRSALNGRNYVERQAALAARVSRGPGVIRLGLSRRAHRLAV